MALGQGRIIAGMDRGLVDTCLWERRRITIPSHLGYGSTGVGTIILPHSTLVFYIRLIKIERVCPYVCLLVEVYIIHTCFVEGIGLQYYNTPHCVLYTYMYAGWQYNFDTLFGSQNGMQLQKDTSLEDLWLNAMDAYRTNKWETVIDQLEEAILVFNAYQNTTMKCLKQCSDRGE